MPQTNYYTQLCDILRIEAQAITQAITRLDPVEVQKAVDLLRCCNGKAIVLGMGKSGSIAQKMAATLTSTGTAAVYLHPSDALHGGLGIISDIDVVIVFSNSGETEEITAMLPYIVHRHLPIIAVVGNAKSALARRSQVILDASVDREACPLNLAPTASTTVALAIADALAMTLMEAKGLTASDFAQNHPAGQLGKRLTLRVADLMHSGKDAPAVNSDASWFEIVAAITKGGMGAVNVIDRAGILAGVITDGDLRRALQKVDHQQLASLTGGDIMTKNPVVVGPDLLAYDALLLMEDRPRQISMLPVVDEERRCLGLLRLHDIIRSGL
jgi:arabinose-5-phosphate isomerase